MTISPCTPWHNPTATSIACHRANLASAASNSEWRLLENDPVSEKKSVMTRDAHSVPELDAPLEKPSTVFLTVLIP